jgi:methionyl-tRNA formyltransferase
MFHEINQKLFSAEIELMDFAIQHFGRIVPKPQPEEHATYYRRRTADDSRIDPSRPLIESLPLLRVADPVRYPAFFEHQGHTYEVVLRKRPTSAVEAQQ